MHQPVFRLTIFSHIGGYGRGMARMRARSIRRGISCAALLALAGCGESDPPVAERAVDPAVLAAINDPILVDPDLSRQNEGNAALTVNVDNALPLENRTLRAIEAAREEALALVGGRDAMIDLPPPSGEGEAAPLAARFSLAERAILSGVGAECAGRAQGGFIWAARMPQTFPLYPRSAAQDAMGNASPGCALRAAVFRTPVPLEEVLAFYHMRALGAGYSSSRTVMGEEQVLRGTQGGAAFAVYARKAPDGTSEVDLVTWGQPR